MLTQEENDLITRVGPGTPMGELLRRFWMPVIVSSEVPTPDCPPIRVRLLGEDLIAFRDTDGRVGLLEQHCAHRGASLFFGRNEECGLRCVYHGWKFDVDGRCVDMPSEPAESDFKSKIHLTAYPTRELAGVIWAYLGPRERMAEPPELEWARVPESYVAVSKYVAECNYVQTMEGDIDSVHTNFLHTSLAEYRLEADAYKSHGGDFSSLEARRILQVEDKTPRFIVKDTNYGLAIGVQRDAGEDHYYWRISQWLTPIFAMVGHNPGIPMSGHALVPIDDHHTMFWVIRWRGDRPMTPDERQRWGGNLNRVALIPGTWRTQMNQDNDYLIDREDQRTKTFSGIGDHRVQDLAMTESMGRIYDRTREHLGSTDLGIIGMRRRLIQAARDLQEGIEPYAAQHPEVYRIRPTAAVLPRAIDFDEDESTRMAMIATA